MPHDPHDSGVYEILDVRREFRESIRELRASVLKTSQDITFVRGKIETILPELPREATIRSIVKNEVAEHYKLCIKKTPKSIVPPPPPAMDKKTIAGFLGLLTMLSLMLGKLVDKLIDLMP